MFLSIIACIDSNNGIGLNGSIPWFIREDLKYFANITKDRWVISGKVTWESIPDRLGNGIRLPNRYPIIVTSDANYSIAQGVVAPNLIKALENIPSDYSDEVIIIGGAKLYESAIHYANKIYLTEINKSYNCDRFFPAIDLNVWEIEYSGDWLTHSSGVEYRFKRLIKNTYV